MNLQETSHYPSEEINQDIFYNNIDLIREKIGQVTLLDQSGEPLEENPLQDLENTVVISNHKYILWDPLVFLEQSANSQNINSILRPVIGANLMPNNLIINYILYYLFKYNGTHTQTKNIQDLFFHMGVIKKFRETGTRLDIENNNMFLGNLANILANGGNIWLSATNGRSKGVTMDIYKNLERLREQHEFHILPSNISYNRELYSDNLLNQKGPKWWLDTVDMGQELSHGKGISPTIALGDKKSFDDYSKSELEQTIFGK